MHPLHHTLRQIVQQLLINKIIHKELILLKQFLQHSQMTQLIATNDILEHEHNPLRYVHLEQLVFTD